ncbi:hypothetical protein [Pseudoalteromonas luteoviolacea]|uniref:Uncharacterized protein n=1 Tax=Pseudoalteromonas luteoviolacea H33 TaxID=1365251 RepID=A0A167EPZ5_9GAMM|nr:hypothetical protein [Pseudoalteromonas luteoviolacea]KZN51060.1 hypothetical protein N476_14290 [Pseudoalteromonas luteoviolacea H33]KZN72147.1 hypothetical protein N477_03135 [Pseudoalteromonas luteoviolacea H33-S]
MIALLSFLLIGFVLFACSKYWPYRKLAGVVKVSEYMTSSRMLAVSVLVLSVFYYFQLGFIAALFLVLFALSIGLPVVVMMGHHRGTTPILILLILAAFGGVL